MLKIIVKKDFRYDDEIIIQKGVYDFIERSTYHFHMIKYNNEWLDLADIDAICDIIKVINY